VAPRLHLSTHGGGDSARSCRRAVGRYPSSKGSRKRIPPAPRRGAGRGRSGSASHLLAGRVRHRVRPRCLRAVPRCGGLRLLRLPQRAVRSGGGGGGGAHSSGTTSSGHLHVTRKMLVSPSELLASPSELLSSPSTLSAAPSTLLAAPRKLTALMFFTDARSDGADAGLAACIHFNPTPPSVRTKLSFTVARRRGACGKHEPSDCRPPHWVVGFATFR
jgi:hypothetical protein